MASREVQDLTETLLRLKLLTQAQINECLLGAAASSREAFIETLERKGLLTSLQSAEIKKGQARGLVLGPYALLYHNASGSFARVYRAKDLRTGQMVGLKVLRARYAKDPKSVAEFRREAELGKTLKHENIVPIYEVSQDGDEHFLSMEFVEGGNLRDFMKIRRKLSPAEATKCCLDIALGLQYALDKGLTHRDLKLTNVLMSARGVAKLVDFGLAGLDPGASANNDVSDSTARAIEYATLEKNTGVPRNDVRSDIYFLGTIYYELLTGEPALPRTKDIQERAEFSNYVNIKPALERDATLPPGVIAVLHKLLQINARLRYQTPGEAAVDLRELLGDFDRIPTLAQQTLPSGSALPMGNGSAASSAAKPASVASSETLPTVLCVEARLKHQDVLRAYFTKHGYRVLMLSDLQRALTRIKTAPPAAVIVMADSLEDLDPADCMALAKITEQRPISAVVLLGDKQAELEGQIHVQRGAAWRVLHQPITLRELHLELRKGLRRTGHLRTDTTESES